MHCTGPSRLRGPMLARCILILVFLGTVALHAGGSGTLPAQDPPTPPPIDDARLTDLAAQLLAGDEGAATLLRGQGPAIVPRLRPHVDDTTAAPFRELVRMIAVDAIRRSIVEEGGVRFRGQFAALRDLGPEGAEEVLELFADEDTVFDVRTRAATALGDIGGPEQVEALKGLADDVLAEAWVEREAIFLLARFGDRTRVEERLNALRRIAEQELTAASLPTILTAHGELAEIHYRIDEFDRAITHYLKKQALLEEMRTRVRPELAAPLQEEIDLLQYNLACSLALGGRLDDAFSALDRSMASRDVTLDMVRTDGDLRAVRADPRYAEWLAGWEARRDEGDGPSEPSPDGDEPDREPEEETP